MRKLIVTAFLPLLLVACASRPNQVRGEYAIVLDPQLDPRTNVGGLPLLHEIVSAALTKRLHITPKVTDADAVILLKPGTTPGQLAYEIRRGETTVASSEKTGIAAPGYRPFPYPSAPQTDGPLVDAVYTTGTHIAEQILYELQKL
jgi:hypothetical protein